MGDTEVGEEDSGALSSIGVSKLGAGVRAAEVVGGAVEAAESVVVVEVGGWEVLVDKLEMDIKSGEVSIDFVLDLGAVWNFGCWELLTDFAFLAWRWA